jgi:4-aminobutyrate aminotransferase-like enzyme
MNRWTIKTKYRRIDKDTVGKDFDNIIAQSEAVEARSMAGQLPIIWDRAKDFQVWDIRGNKFIDFSSTIFVANTGHGNRKVVKSLVGMLKRPLMHAYTFPTAIKRNYLVYLINTLQDMCGGWAQKAFLMSSGTESVECAIKLSRLNGQRHSSDKIKIVAFEGNWHGRTMGSQSLSSNFDQKKWIGYTDPNIIHLPFPYPWATQEEYGEQFFQNSLTSTRIDPSKIAGFVLESYQGWSSAFYPKSFVKAVEKFCLVNECVLTFDEIQSGFGRTGKLFAFQHYDVRPDLVCCGKGVSSGFPLSMVVGRQSLLDLPERGSMSSTHSANPLACAAGLANLRYIMETDLLRQTELKGFIFQGELRRLAEKYSGKISRVEGKGLVAAVYFKDAEMAKSVCYNCVDRGLIPVFTGKQTVKLAPPLTIPQSAMMEGLNVFDESVLYTLP